MNTPQTTTVLSSIRLNGEKAFTTYQGGTTGERFVQYLKETLLPTLKPGDIVVMDNMRSHHVKAVREVLEEKGMKVSYLPPYSPDLNPIEKMWSKMKALLRGWKVRSLDLLPDAVRMALASVAQLDCLLCCSRSNLFQMIMLQYNLMLPHNVYSSDQRQWADI